MHFALHFIAYYTICVLCLFADDAHDHQFIKNNGTNRLPFITKHELNVLVNYVQTWTQRFADIRHGFDAKMS